MKMRWKYLIVDEMQQIKNMTEKHWEALFSLRRYGAENRFPAGSGVFSLRVTQFSQQKTEKKAS